MRWFLSLRVWASGCRRARARPTSCRRSPRARTSASTGQTPPSPTASFPPPKWRAHSITPLSARPLPPKPPLPLCTPRKVCCSWHKISGYSAYWYSIRWCLGQDGCHISQSVVQGRCHGFPLLGITGFDGEHFSKRVVALKIGLKGRVSNGRLGGAGAQEACAVCVEEHEGVHAARAHPHVPPQIRLLLPHCPGA